MLTYAYNLSVHLTTGHTPLEIVRFLHPPDFGVARDENGGGGKKWKDREYFVGRMTVEIEDATVRPNLCVRVWFHRRLTFAYLSGTFASVLPDHCSNPPVM